MASSLPGMFERGLARLAGERTDPSPAAAFFRPSDRVGVKINTLGGRALSTRPEVAAALADGLVRAGVPKGSIFVWDRTERELREAGYTTASGPSGFKVLATDTPGVGYERELVSHRSIGSLFSRIQTELVTASVSLAILKDHGLAGVTAGMKNYFGAVHNPNKYHDSRCDPFVADMFDTPAIKEKHRLTVLDALLVQFHKGPSYHSRWVSPFGGLVFSADPVAADRVGWRIIDALRERAGLPSLTDDGREPLYLRTAERMGLGRADLASIEIIEETFP